ncbi:uncharacterized protein PG986_008793 [Apiospora aurea]|uniref:Uncharacterized protein n=1 Tax=Apiospora aurea TaxID=335848 RepID=A0ABR1Q6J0_9PEZI
MDFHHSDLCDSNVKYASWRVTGILLKRSQEGYVAWTPAYRCTKGTLKRCDGGRTEEKEACAPFVVDRVIRGDYSFVQMS